MPSYIRVSEILSRLQSFATIDPIVLANKAKIGTNVHNAILADSAGEFPILESERESAYFGSYGLFKKKANPKFKMQVPRLYDDALMITGEIDGLVDEGGKHPYLIDWKCSANTNEEIWEMQAHFYWYLLKQNDLDVGNRMVWVNLRHRKWLEEDRNGSIIERYAPLAPKICEFFFNENVLSRCIDEANKAWEEKRSSMILDF